MIVRRFLSPSAIAGAVIVVAVAVFGGFLRGPLPVDTAVWSDFIPRDELDHGGRVVGV